jgi:hypothetical protein
MARAPACSSCRGSSPPSAAGAVARRGLALVEKMVGTADASDRQIGSSTSTTAANRPAFDTDEFFRTMLGLALDGLERRTTS